MLKAILSKGHLTLELEGPWLVIYKLCDLVKKLKTVQVHFTLDLQGINPA